MACLLPADMLKLLRRTPRALSVWSATNVSPARVGLALAPLRPLDPEVLLVVDDRVPSRWDEGYRRLANRVVRVPFRGSYGRIYPWVRTLCRGRWILQLDADEVPSATLAAEVAATLQEPGLTHAWMPRRWLYGGTDRYLAQWPWMPDYVLRLFRNDPAVVRFPGLMHEPVAASGPRRYLAAPLLHLDLLLSSFEHRVAKCSRLEQARGGMRVDGLPFNDAYYLPELREGLRTAALPPADANLAAAFLAARASGRAPGSAGGGLQARHHSPSERTVARRELTGEVHVGCITVCDADMRAVAGSSRTFDVVVENLGSEVWPGGMAAHPQIRLAYRLGGEEGLRTPLGAPLAPGGSCRVPLAVRIPQRSGTLRLQVDLVHEHVRWFECGVELAIEIVEPPRLRSFPIPAAPTESPAPG